MPKPRNPIAVATQIANVVPTRDRAHFERLATSFSYKAPEQVAHCFRELSNACQVLLFQGQLEHDWQLEMISILTTKSKEELFAEQKAREEINV